MAKAKEKAKSSAPSKKWEFYDGTSKKRKECPKCGKGVFLGEYKNPDRLVCGKCGYTEHKKENN